MIRSLMISGYENRVAVPRPTPLSNEVGQSSQREVPSLTQFSVLFEWRSAHERWRMTPIGGPIKAARSTPGQASGGDTSPASVRDCDRPDCIRNALPANTAH